MSTSTVELQGRTYELRLPRSFAQRHEIVAAGAHNLPRAACAALGVCVELKVKARYNYQPLVYGGEVLDELVARGCDPAAIFTAASEAFEQLANSVVTTSDLKAAEGNSVAPAGA